VDRGEFDVLVVRDLDRLARDAKRLIAMVVRLEDAGVRVWSYVDGTFATLDGVGLLGRPPRG
jgi:DNA invertase Pin-like site-specific DNA recombinase